MTAAMTSHAITTEALVSHLQTIVRDAGELLGQLSDATGEEFAQVRSEAMAMLISARSRLEDARGMVRKGARDAVHASETYVKENPWKVLAVVSAGIVLGIVLSRRRELVLQ